MLIKAKQETVPNQAGTNKQMWDILAKKISPFSIPCAPRGEHLHAGTDIYAPRGTTVRAILPGEVIWAGKTYGAYQNAVITKSELNGETIYVIYAHLDEDIKLKQGQKVLAGEGLASVGPHHAGPHLHFEILTNLDEICVSKTDTPRLERGINKIGKTETPASIPEAEEGVSGSPFYSFRAGKVNQAEDRVYIAVNPFAWGPVKDGEIFFPVESARYTQRHVASPGGSGQD